MNKKKKIFPLKGGKKLHLYLRKTHLDVIHLNKDTRVNGKGREKKGVSSKGRVIINGLINFSV